METLVVMPGRAKKIFTKSITSYLDADTARMSTRSQVEEWEVGEGV